MIKKLFDKLSIVILFLIAMAPCEAQADNYDGTYYNPFEALICIKGDSISFYKYTRAWGRILGPTLIAKGTFCQLQGYTIWIQSPQKRPFGNAKVSIKKGPKDYTNLTIKIPNYQFYKAVYPIITLSSGLYIKDNDKFDWTIPLYCFSDSVSTTLPPNFLDGGIAVTLRQTTYENSNPLEIYLGRLSYSDFIELPDEIHYGDDIVLTFPDITNSVFETWDVDNVFAQIEDDIIYFFNKRYYKVSPETILGSEEEIIKLYEIYVEETLQKEEQEYIQRSTGK